MSTIRHHKKFGISIWKDLVRNVLKQEKKRIIIIGPSNSGKSTLSLYMANVFISHGLRPLLIDADMGQGDLAPPTCLGAAVMNYPGSRPMESKNKLYQFYWRAFNPSGMNTKLFQTIRQHIKYLIKT